MAVSVREICNCIGLTGRISIVKDFFGYRNAISTTTPAPLQPISLRRQLMLLKNGPHIRIHIKIVDPTWRMQSSIASTDLLLQSMRLVYGNLGIGVVVKSTEVLDLPPDFLDIDVGDCRLDTYWGVLTDDQANLFNNKNNVVYEYDDFGEVFTREIVLFFVLFISGTSGAAAGCAISPYTSPCAVIAWGDGESPNTMAHEVGHLLGLHGHPDQNSACLPNRLMTSCGSNSNSLVTNSELQTMLSSSLMFRC